MEKTFEEDLLKTTIKSFCISSFLVVSVFRDSSSKLLKARDCSDLYPLPRLYTRKKRRKIRATRKKSEREPPLQTKRGLFGLLSLALSLVKVLGKALIGSTCRARAEKKNRPGNRVPRRAGRTRRRGLSSGCICVVLPPVCLPCFGGKRRARCTRRVWIEFLLPAGEREK